MISWKEYKTFVEYIDLLCKWLDDKATITSANSGYCLLLDIGSKEHVLVYLLGTIRFGWKAWPVQLRRPILCDGAIMKKGRHVPHIHDQHSSTR